MTSGLRTLLRMDPDVMFLGEIRDAEAAEIAMRAASSGKYVFSTLHSRDVASTITALRDLGIDARSLAGNLTGIVSQRLVRRLCLECRLAVSLNDDDRALLEKHSIEPPAQWFRAVGCSACRGTGYRRRIGVFEVVLADDGLLREIARGAAEHELREYIRRYRRLDERCPDQGLRWSHEPRRSHEDELGLSSGIGRKAGYQAVSGNGPNLLDSIGTSEAQ
jgi:general secretion pathway protein E